jgi:hypothetical protein
MQRPRTFISERQVSRGDPWVRRSEALTRVLPTARLHRCCLVPLFSAPCELLAISQVCDKTTTTLSADDLIHRPWHGEPHLGGFVAHNFQRLPLNDSLLRLCGNWCLRKGHHSQRSDSM